MTNVMDEATTGVVASVRPAATQRSPQRCRA